MEQVRDWLGHSSVLVTEKSYAFLHVHALREAIDDVGTNKAQRVVNFQRKPINSGGCIDEQSEL